MDLDWNLTAAAAETSWAHAAVRVATGGALVASGKTSGYKRSEERRVIGRKLDVQEENWQKHRRKQSRLFLLNNTAHFCTEKCLEGVRCQSGLRGHQPACVGLGPHYAKCL